MIGSGVSTRRLSVNAQSASKICASILDPPKSKPTAVILIPQGTLCQSYAVQIACKPTWPFVLIHLTPHSLSSATDNGISLLFSQIAPIYTVTVTLANVSGASGLYLRPRQYFLSLDITHILVMPRPLQAPNRPPPKSLVIDKRHCPIV